MIRRIAAGCGTFELSDEGPHAAPSSPVEPVVLLHGFTGSKESWLQLREWLRRTRRVLSIDLPGHGGTTFQGDGVENCSMEACAAAIIELLTGQLGVPRFALIGYSMGGRLALFIALEYGEYVTKLVIESASAGIADPGEREARRASDEELAKFIETRGIEAFVDRWERMALFASLRNQPEHIRAELRRERLASSGAGLAAGLRGMGVGRQPWLGARLSELKMPALIVAGALDAKFVEIGRNLSAGIRGSRLEIIEGAGHIPHLERAAAFSRLVTDFLDAGPGTISL